MQGWSPSRTGGNTMSEMWQVFVWIIAMTIVLRLVGRT